MTSTKNGYFLTMHPATFAKNEQLGLLFKSKRARKHAKKT